VQPVYVTLPSSATGVSAWKVANWQISPQQLSFAVLSSGGSSGTVDITYEDPSFTYQNPNSSSPSAFSAGQWGSSANSFVSLPSSLTPIAGYRLNVTAASGTVGGKITLVALQSGIG